MQTRTRGLAFFVALILGGGYALTSVEATVPPQDAALAKLPEVSALSAAMGGMADAKRTIRDAVEARDGAAALIALTDFQTHIVAAKAEAPPRAAKLTESEKAVFVAGFRGALCELLRVTCELELALLEGRLEDATAILRKQMGALEDAGHTRFGGDDD